MGMETPKWKKWPIGKIYGHSVFLELPPGLSGAEEKGEINRASLLLETMHKDHEFVAEMRDYLAPPTNQPEQI